MATKKTKAKPKSALVPRSYKWPEAVDLALKELVRRREEEMGSATATGILCELIMRELRSGRRRG